MNELNGAVADAENMPIIRSILGPEIRRVVVKRAYRKAKKLLRKISNKSCKFDFQGDLLAYKDDVIVKHLRKARMTLFAQGDASAESATKLLVRRLKWLVGHPAEARAAL